MLRRFSIKKEGIPKGMPSHCLYIKSRSGDNTVSADYLLENWGARRAAFRPYFNRLSDDFP